jgi:uncharacterized repeat protein (TIGR04052 family)
MKHTTIFSASLVAAAAATLVACGGGDSGPVAVDIQFAAMAGSTPIACGTPVTGLGLNGISANVHDFRFYVSAASMIRADGVDVPITLPANDNWNYTSGSDAVTLIDLENATGTCPTATGTAATNASLKGTVPAGTYTGVKMTLGVPFALNHTDWANPTTTKAPLDIQALAWNWQGGRKFTKIEVTQPTGATWSAPTFNVHLGSTGCIGNPATGSQVSSCSAPNRGLIKLASFDPSTQKIAVDVKELLAGIDITTNTAGTSAGCMSGGTDPECLNVFKALGIDWKADGTGTGLPLATQTVFRAIAK